MSESTKTEKLVGVEVSHSIIRAVCLQRDGKINDAVRAVLNNADDKFAQVAAFINEIKNRFGNFEKIGIAVPGLVHGETRRVAYSKQFPEHEQIDFLENLETKTNLKVLVDNDANAAAFGEFTLGAGRGSNSMFYATIGSGVGGAFIFDGKIWRGASGFAGEFGHIVIDSEGLKLEDLASAANIVRRTKARFHQDQTSSLNKIGEEKISLTDIVAAARREDDFAQMMLVRTGTYVGTAIAGVINLLNVERIVIGGEIIQEEVPVLEAIVERAREMSFAPSFENTEIVEGKLGENAAAVGAGLLSAGL